MSNIKPGYIKHGANITGKRTKLYGRWLTMRNKCTNPKHHAYKWYGARGIKVCERWNDFSIFLADVGEIPGPGMTLDRIDNDGNYEPSNVRWATREVQSNNKPDGVGNRGVRLVTLPDGRRMSMNMAARAMGLNETTLKTRVQRGVPPQHLFDPPGTVKLPKKHQSVSPR